MTDSRVAIVPFKDAAEIHRVNADLLQAMDRRLGDDSRPESESAALRELESKIRDFLDSGAATGSFVEEIRERTACQVLLDYWSSTLSHAGIPAPRPRLAPFDAQSLPDLGEEKCPYVSLEPFRTSTFFFGREKAIASLLQRVSEEPLVVVQGGAGSGKSSLVMGGALPLLGAAEHLPKFRVVGPFTPGNTVLENMVDAVNTANPGAHFDRVEQARALRENPALLPDMLGVVESSAALLVIDQFEEALALCSNDDCTRLAAAIDALLQSCPDSRVILTLREEYANKFDLLEPLRPYLSRHARFSMKEWPMGYNELRAAVERPAAIVGLHFAPGIVDDMVKSVLGQDTALPLLQFTLQSLWKLRDHNRITRDAYKSVGAPLVALERYADRFFQTLPPEDQKETERILLELVHIDRMMEAYRKPKMLRAFPGIRDPRTRDMIKLLADHDFLRSTPTVDGDAIVEVKHDALLRNWPPCARWIADKRERARQRVTLTEAAQRWDASGRSSIENLLSAWQLHDARQLTDLDQLEQDYVRASKEHLETDERARDWNRRLKYILSAFAAVMLVFLGDSLVMLVSTHTDRDRAQVLEQFARATEASYRGQIDEALIGGLQAGFNMAALPDKIRANLRPQMREALLSTLKNATNLKRLFVQDDGTDKIDATFNAVAFHPTRPDKLIAFGGSSGWVYLASLRDVGKQAPPALNACVDDRGVSSLAFESEGRLLVVGCRTGKLSVWSADDWRLIGDTKVSSNFIRSLSIQRGGRLVAATAGTRIALVQLDEKGVPSKRPVTFAQGKGGGVQTVVFSPSDDTLVAGDGDGYILVCRPGGDKSWDCNYPQGYDPVANDAVLTFAYSPDGEKIAVGHYWRGAVDIWDKDFSPSSRRTIYRQSPSAVYSLAFFEACGIRQLAIATNTGLEYSPVEESPPGAGAADFCARARSAEIGDQTYSVAFRDGLLAATTQAGYVAVLAPAGGEDPLRARVQREKLAANREPIRGALVAEAGSTAWLALQNIPTETDRSNVAIWELSDGHAENVLTFPAGRGEIMRLSASQTRRLAAISCTVSSSTKQCVDDEYEVTVLQFADRMDARPASIVSLSTRDLLGKIPVRATLSPDGRFLAISFEPKQGSSEPQILLLEPDHPNERKWINSDLKRIKEIAFSEDGKTFAAGGCCGDDAGSDLDQIQLWSVDKSGLTSTRWTPKRRTLALSQFAQGVQDLTFASATLLVGGRFGAIDIWPPGAEAPSELRIDTHGVSFVTFSRDEGLVAAASSQGVVRLWDTSRWPPFELTPPADDPAIPGFLAFAGNGTRLISSADAVDFWDLDPASLQRKVCALLWEVDPEGIKREAPWHKDKECKNGALTPPTRSFLERVENFLVRAWAAVRGLPGRQAS